MNTHAAIPITDNRFAFGYYRQSWWNWLIGSAFFLGEVGAGLFLFSLWTDYGPGMWAGYLILMLGKNGFHLLYLGRPERFFRAAARPDRSWIARGIWAIGFLGLSGFVCLLSHLPGVTWQLNGLPAAIAFWVATIASLVVMFYDGFVMNASPAIPFWNTRLLPLLCLTYAALGGATLSLTLRGLAGGGASQQTSQLMEIEQILLAANFLVLTFYLLQSGRRDLTARENARLLLRGPFAPVFWGLVVITGLGLTLLLSLLSGTESTALVLAVAASELAGDFALVMVLLKSGIYAPQTAPAYRRVEGFKGA